MCKLYGLSKKNKGYFAFLIVYGAKSIPKRKYSVGLLSCVKKKAIIHGYYSASLVDV